MIFRYFYEAFVGAICITLILLVGTKGLAGLALLAFLPVFLRARRVRPDERDLSLFYKTGNLTLGIMLISVFLIYKFSSAGMHGHTLGENWVGLIAALAVLFHGLAGLIMHKFN